MRAAKYPPMGARSWGGYTAQQASGLAPAEYLREANRMTMVFAMVETVEALENVEAIAATPGLDGLFVGPSDLSITLSRGAGIDKTGQGDAGRDEEVAAAAKENGLVAGAFGGSADAIKAYLGTRLHVHRGCGGCRPDAVGRGRTRRIARAFDACGVPRQGGHHGSACFPHSRR